MEYITNNLDYWKNKKWTKDDFINCINNNPKIKLVLIEINNNNIIYTPNILKKNRRLSICNKLLKDIIIKYNNLNVVFLLCLNDELVEYNDSIYDLKDRNLNYNKYEFKWGLATEDSNVIKINNNKLKIFDCPIFTFNKIHESHIIFPSPNLIEQKFILDNIEFNNKINNIPIGRFSESRTGLLVPCRYKLVALSYLNQSKIDFKGGQKNKHVFFNNYIISPSFIELYKKLNIINKSINTNELIEYYNINNYIPILDIIKNKYLIMIDTWNNINYLNTNSIIFRTNCSKYYHDFFLEDKKDYQYTINNRKIKVDKYLKYDSIVNNFGLLLKKYSEL